MEEVVHLAATAEVDDQLQLKNVVRQLLQWKK